MYRIYCAFLLALACLPLFLSAQPQTLSTIYGSGYHLVDAIPQGSSLFDLAFDPPALAQADAAGFPSTVEKLLHPGIERITNFYFPGSNNFYLAGEGANGIFLMEVNFAFQPIWLRMYGGLSSMHSFLIPFGGGFLLSGTSSGTNKILVVKTNQTGVPEWSHTFDLNSQDEFPTVATQLRFGTSVVTGSMTRAGQSHQDMFFLQLDNAGAVLRALAFQTGNSEVPLSIEPTVDGGFAVSGYSLVNNEEKAFVASFDSTCQPNWSRQIIPDSISRASEMKPFGSSFTSVSEVQVGNDSLQTRILVQQWDEIGNLTYTQRLGLPGINRPKAMAQDGAGRYIFGQLSSPDVHTGFLEKFIPGFAEPCTATINTIGWDTITYTTDTLTASMAMGPPSVTDSLPFLQPTSIFANQACNPTIGLDTKIPETIKVYPNPAASHFQLKMTDGMGGVFLVLRDIQGRRIWEQTATSNTPQQRFALPQGGQGIYFLEIISEKGRWVKKILAQP